MMVQPMLERFRAAGVLSVSDVHLARTLSRLAAEEDPDVSLAVALAARAPRHGHVAVDLTSISESVLTELDEMPTAQEPDEQLTLEWPETQSWLAALAGSPLVSSLASGVAVDSRRPLVLSNGLLYLQRYWAYEQVLAEHLLRRAQAVMPAVPRSGIAATLLTGEGAEQQLVAVDVALHRGLTVLVGGPGTGKTTTVAALLAELLGGLSTVESEGLSVALAAPTGKAAARMGEAFRLAAQQLPPELAARLLTVEASTIHRLLGTRPGPGTSFRHDRRNPLHHDVVIIDESSMVSLPLMTRLVDAVRPEARLVIVGDPGQLASIEAGSVLADLAGPLIDTPAVSAPAVSAPAVSGPAVTAFFETEPADSPIAAGVVLLRHSRRFPPASPLDRVARAITAGDAQGALEVLGDPAAADAPAGALSWIPYTADQGHTIDLLQPLVLASAAEVVRQALLGSELRTEPARLALDSLEAVRVLCAHRLGPFGVDRWNNLVERWLAADGFAVSGWYPGRPVMVTANDYRLGVFNGDLGVVTISDGRPSVAFAAADGIRFVSPHRLESIETVHAMTIHKSQGSEFDHVIVVLPSAESRLATRELLYTAVTRARRRVTVVGTAEMVRAAIGRRVVRSSGLRSALWATPAPRSPTAADGDL
jgi:exodeoxyribonuclease V alpha subunit